MKSCPMCGTDAGDDTPTCENCGYNFSNLGPSLGSDQQRAGPAPKPVDQLALERPTGITPMVIGWFCLAIAIILVVVSLGQGERWERNLASNPYASADLVARVAQANARAWLFQLAAGSFFSLFLVFWSVGYIVRAISFLPGSDK